MTRKRKRYVIASSAKGAIKISTYSTLSLDRLSDAVAKLKKWKAINPSAYGKCRVFRLIETIAVEKAVGK